MKTTRILFGLSFLIIFAGISLISCQSDDPQVNIDGIMFAILRNVDEGVVATDEVHGYAIMDFNPFSENFGDTLQNHSPSANQSSIIVCKLVLLMGLVPFVSTVTCQGRLWRRLNSSKIAAVASWFSIGSPPVNAMCVS